MTRYVMVSSVQQLLSLVLLGSSFVSYTESCSRRSTPKPRSPNPLARGDNATYSEHSQAAQQPACPQPYDTDFCLNGGTCFSIQIGDSPPSINCACTAGWTGRRCELKDLPDNYFVKSSDLKGASLHSGVVVIVLFVIIIIATIIIVRFHWRSRSSSTSSTVSTALRHAKIFAPTSYENLSQTGKEPSPETRVSDGSSASVTSPSEEKLPPHR